MAADLNLYEPGGNFGLEESHRNKTGTPIVAIRKKGDNRQRSDVYRLTFSSVVPGTSATCHVGTDQPHNPSRNTGGVAVVLDGTTWNANVIEGLEIQFSSSGSFTSAWEADVFYGAYFDSPDEFDVLNFGEILAGDTTAGKRVRVQNDGADLAASCTVRVLNGVRFVNGVGGPNAPFVSIAYTELEQTTNFDPGYAITFANKVAGSPDVIDILVAGNTRDVKRIDTGEVFPGGAGVPMDGATILEWTTGPLTGLRFVLATSTSDTSTATMYVSDAARLYEIAPDVSGAAGTWQAGGTPLTLTEDGGSQSGEISSGGAAFFWVRMKTQGTDSPVGNQRHARILTRGLSV